MDRLLLISCSRRKRAEPQPLPALERYDGPAFRLVRRFIREQPTRCPDILILSARYGLLPRDQLVPTYDSLITTERAKQLAPGVLRELRGMARSRAYGDFFIFAGELYADTITTVARSIPNLPPPRSAGGGIGVKLTALRAWLRGDAGENASVVPKARGTATLRGVAVRLSAAQVYAAARRWLAEDGAGARRYHGWFVQVDDERLSPKWLASRLTSLPVGSFHTDDARRMLAQLGVPTLNAFVEPQEVKDE